MYGDYKGRIMHYVTKMGTDCWPRAILRWHPIPQAAGVFFDSSGSSMMEAVGPSGVNTDAAGGCEVVVLVMTADLAVDPLVLVRCPSGHSARR